MNYEIFGLLCYAEERQCNFCKSFQASARFLDVVKMIIENQLALLIVSNMNFMVAPCVNNIKQFIVQLMHTNYKILRLLK
jgi:hypothetical protein